MKRESESANAASLGIAFVMLVVLGFALGSIMADLVKETGKKKPSWVVLRAQQVEKATTEVIVIKKMLLVPPTRDSNGHVLYWSQKDKMYRLNRMKHYSKINVGGTCTVRVCRGSQCYGAEIIGVTKCK